MPFKHAQTEDALIQLCQIILGKHSEVHRETFYLSRWCYEPLTRIGIKVVFLDKDRYQSEVWVRARRNVLSVSRIKLWAEYKYEVDYKGQTRPL